MVDASGHLDREQWLQPMLELGGRDLGPGVAPAIAEGLRTSKMIRYLGLRKNGLGDAGVRDICQGLRENTGVEIVDLSENRITDAGALHLGELLAANPTVQSLILSGNKIKKLGAQALARGLRVNHRLRKLVLTSNKVRCAGATALAEALEVNTTLEQLNLSGNEVNLPGAQALASALATSNLTLQSLSLAHNKVGLGVVGLGAALAQQGNRSGGGGLAELNLQSNLITTAHAVEFAERLYRASLRTVNLADNLLGDEGAKAVLSALSEPSCLRYVDLSNVGLTAKSMEEVCRTLRMCPDLETLQLDCNHLGCEGVTVLASTLKEAPGLASLSLDRCGLDTPAVVALALALYASPGFRTLSVSGNALPDEACRSLCYALKRMTQLRSVDLSQNRISNDLLPELCAVFVNNTLLSSIQLLANPIADELVNGTLSRREALSVLDALPDSSALLVLALPLPSRNPPLKGNSTSFTATTTLPLLRAGTPSSVMAAALSTSSGSLPLAETSADARGILWPVKPASSLAPSPPGVATRTTLTSSSSPPTKRGTPGATLSSGYGNTNVSASLGSAAGGLRSMQVIPYSTLAELTADQTLRQNHTYPPLIPSLNSLEHPYYPGFGKGRFSNSSLVQEIGGQPYTLANSHGFTMLQKWSDSIPTSETFFASGLRRVPRAYAYSESVLENNIGGLLVTERQLRQAFSELDRDGKGWLDEKEFAELFGSFENFGIFTTERKVKEALRRYKRQNDGRVTFDEFSLLMLAVAQR